MAAAPDRPEAFTTQFVAWARWVRRRLALRSALTGLTLGSLAAVVLAGGAWWLRWDELRLWTLVTGGLGILGGLLLSLRRRWSDPEVALFLDARLGSHETISTALESEASESVRAHVRSRAEQLLAQARATRARPRIWRRLHGLAPLGVLTVAGVAWAPLPPPPPAPAPVPGAQLVKQPELRGLAKIEALEKLPARDAAQHRRLAEIAQKARELHEDLARGVEKREAQARIAELRDDIARERLRFGDERNRAGLAAAIRQLEKHAELRELARALGDGDLTKFDEQMQRLANEAETDARQTARQALEEARQAARQRGARELEEWLERQQQVFERQQAKTDALRELARQLQEQLGDAAPEGMEAPDTTGDPEARQRLADSLEDALEGLSNEERRRLAENLAKRLEGPSGMTPLGREQLKHLTEQLEQDGGQEQLKQLLRDFARTDPGKDAARERGLDEAERGGADAERQLGVVPVPRDTSGPGARGDGRPGDESSSGPGPGREAGKHDGETDRVTGDGLRAKVRPRLNPGVPLLGGSLGRAPARPGETARQRGVGALGEVSGAEVDAIERSNVPEEYKEQVGRYFEP